MFYFVVVFVILVFKDHPVYSALQLQKCNINKPDVSNCVFEALNSLRSETRREDKQIKESSSEPYVIPTFQVTQESSVVNYTGTATNLIIRGLDNFDLKYVRFDPETMTFHGRVEYNSLALNADYEVEGHWLSVLIKGKGPLHAALGSINAKVEVIGEMANKNGANHYNPTGLKIRMIIDDVDMYFDGLFGQNAELARVTNDALNANSKLIIEALTPAIEIVCEKVFLKAMKSISGKVLHGK